MNLFLAILAISALAVALASHTRTRHLVRDINAITQPHVPARHAVVRNPAGPRQRPTGRMPERERIPIQVPPEVEAANARAIEGYDNGADDDLLIRPFATVHTAADDTETWRVTPGAEDYLWTPEQCGYPADNTAAVSAVP